ncbi:hypothetical protein FJY63_05150 [Candidatus Sumerlaeota bacterium]|nr:hypothetical protein [Candidatus Sumerlaeota bacterium]
MNRFVEKYGNDVTGILRGFDRLVFRGTARALAVRDRLDWFLTDQHVLLKDWDRYVHKMTEQLKKASCGEALRLGRPVRYLGSTKLSKEDVARAIAKRDGITKGLICVLTCVEPCWSFEIQRNPEKRRLVLVSRQRKCMFLYHYWCDPVFGFMNARIQTWFPFSIQVCINGREWLARTLDRAGVRYERWENCFPWIEDVAAAQRLMDVQLRTAWPDTLRDIARRLNPAHEEMFAPAKVSYYWSVYQDEWATDVMFRSPKALAAIYPKLMRGALIAFGSEDVMRFLGRKPHGRFQGQVITSLLKRPEGVRIKHQVGENSIKAYDKFCQIFRVENTMNNPRDFKVYRPKEGGPKKTLAWRPLRRGVADIHRRADVQQAANERYLDALASLDTDRSVKEVVTPVCRPTRWKHQRVRALRPWSEPDQPLLHIISRGEFILNGFRNRDILAHLYPDELSPSQQRQKAAARITRLLRLLRAHGLIRKVPHTHRYLLTPKGREITSAVIQLYNVPLTRVAEVAA